jgi:hypothetical protein
LTKIVSMDELRGNQAEHFANQLRMVQRDGARWETEYEDPKTGERWLLDYPQSELQGGGEVRLRRLSVAVDSNLELFRSGYLWELIDNICAQLRFANDKEEAEKLRAARTVASSRSDSFDELSVVLTEIIDNHLSNPDLGGKLRTAREIIHWVVRYGVTDSN